eukprot:TRINITY_DN39587_c0_g2_i1.p1 TRINITY_DN39587_c0_g2~~TRINITY_DN39587_c0_g2_i1.p1  ORF type:complete len:273 (-),score=35.64 TRINITY_DN39587_c0_g2_i1:9-806(-)
MGPPARELPFVIQHLHPQEWRQFKIVSKKQMSSNMWLFRFALPENATLGCEEVERHVRVRLPVQGGSAPSVVREYTPVSPLNRRGSFDLAVKIYPEGVLTPELMKMGPGQCVEMCGPHGDLTIRWSKLTAIRSQQMTPFDRLVLLAAGSGVTPMIQILQDWVARGHEFDGKRRKIDLLYVNHCEDDIAFNEELRQLTDAFPDCFRLLLAVSQPKDTWTGHRGRPDFALLEQWLGKCQEATCAIVCGPQQFNREMVEHFAKQARAV